MPCQPEPRRVTCEGLGASRDRTLDDDELSRIAHALAHPARIAIVRQLAGQDGCVAGDIFEQLSLAQSTVSEHLRVLKDASIVHSISQGNRMYYCLDGDLLACFSSIVARIANEA